jgi:hypothetical protein
MRFPTLRRFSQLLHRYSQGAFPIGFYYPPAPPPAAPPCSKQRPLCSLAKPDPQRVEKPGVKIRWMNVR